MKFPFKTKICGVTTVDDAIMVASSGAEAIGLNFYSAGKRFIEPALARIVADAVHETHAEMVIVGVFVNDSVSFVIIESSLGLKKQKIELGKTNDNFVVATSGVTEGEELLLVKPEDVETISWR